MSTIKYCVNCQRVFLNMDSCKFCGCENLKELKKNAPVNVLGTKLKGRVFRYTNETITLIINTESNEKILRDYKINELRKIN